VECRIEAFRRGNSDGSAAADNKSAAALGRSVRLGWTKNVDTARWRRRLASKWHPALMKEWSQTVARERQGHAVRVNWQAAKPATTGWRHQRAMARCLSLAMTGTSNVVKVQASRATARKNRARAKGNPRVGGGWTGWGQTLASWGWKTGLRHRRRRRPTRILSWGFSRQRCSRGAWISRRCLQGRACGSRGIVPSRSSGTATCR
jgi:hypothetical protein